MRPLRIYHTRKQWIWCRVDFHVTDQDWEQDPDFASTMERNSIYMRATVLYQVPNGPKDCPARFSVRAHPNVPRDIVFKEAEIFLQTLQKMYDL